MLGWSVAFFVLAVIAAFLGFTGLAGTLSAMAVILFWIFLGLLVLTFLIRALQGRSVI